MSVDWFDRTVIDGIVRGVAQMADLGAAGSTWVEKYVIYGCLNVVGIRNHLAARRGGNCKAAWCIIMPPLLWQGCFCWWSSFNSSCNSNVLR